MASARPPKGGEQEDPSEHGFDGFSYLVECNPIDHANMLVETLRVY